MKPVVAITTACFVVAALTLSSGQSGYAAPPDDSTATLQAKFDALEPGESITLDSGTYPHSGVIQIRVPGVRINGNGATLQATNDLTSSVQITANGVSLTNLNLTAPLGGPRYSAVDQHKLVIQANDVSVSDITITGSAAAGVFIDGSSNFQLDRVTVRDSRADGIHMTDGSNNGRVNNPTTERTGDDGVAVVSYTERFLGRPSEPCRNIVIDSPVVNGTTWGQGVTALGGENISYRNINVSRTNGAGVFIATVGEPFFTKSTSGVDVSGGSVTGANVNPGVVMGAVAVYGEHRGYITTNVTISNLTVLDTPPSAQRNIAVFVKDGGAVDRIAFRDIRIQQQTDLPPIFSNAPRDSYTASGITMNGTPVAVT